MNPVEWHIYAAAYELLHSPSARFLTVKTAMAAVDVELYAKLLDPCMWRP